MKISRKGIETTYRLIPLWFVATVIVIGIAAAAALVPFTLSGSSAAEATTTTSSTTTTALAPATITGATISTPATASDLAGICSTTATTFSCSGTSILSGEDYTVSVGINNPNASPLPYSTNPQDTGLGWTSTCTGPSTLAPGANTVTCTVSSTSGIQSADTFSVSISG
jgi:hypothetical protein